MEWYKWAVLVFAWLFITVGADVYAQTVTIHDVFVMGTAVQGQPVSSTNGCASLIIGSAAGTGTDYGKLKIKGANGTDPARIVAVENGISNCFGMAVNSTRDRLLLMNTLITPNTTGVNVDLTLEYRGDFDHTPDGLVVFGGNMTGTFRRNGAAVTCAGSTPPNGPCKVVYDTGVFSQVDSLEHALPEISNTNPFGGSFNVPIPVNPAIDVGSSRRDLHAIITTKLPSTNHTLDIRGNFVIFRRHDPNKIDLTQLGGLLENAPDHPE